jgi:AraC-like DNA-binding protein
MQVSHPELQESEILLFADINPHVRAINLYPCVPGFDTEDRILYDHYLLYVHGGKGAFRVGETWYESEPGDLYYCPPGLVQRIRADEADPFLLTGVDFDLTLRHRDRTLPYSTEAAAFDPGLLPPTPSCAELDRLPAVLHLSGDPVVRERLLAILAVYDGGPLHGAQETGGLLKALLARLLRAASMERAGGCGTSRVEEVVRYLSEHHGSGVTVASTAERFHYHPDHLSRLMKAYSGMTLKRYLTGLRVREALALLRDTREPITSIAERTGFYSAAHFSRVFHEETGHPPSAFR